MDYKRFYNDVAKNRVSYMLLDKYPVDKTCKGGLSGDVIDLSFGSPSNSSLPIVKGTFQLQDGTSITLTPDKMTLSLQYGPEQGYGPLLNQLRTLTQMVHSPPRWQEREVLVTTGSQHALSMAVEMMLTKGQVVLVEEPSYAGFLDVVIPHCPRFVSVDSDGEGMIPDSLSAALDACPPQDKPKFLYTVPTGANPSGAVTPEARRRSIYDLCCQHDLLILEDDPYYFLHYQGEAPPPSYLHLDADNRVLRLDSFSKVVSPGLRLGWVTAPRQLISKLQAHQGVAIVCVNTLSQVLMSELLQVWGREGLEHHLSCIRQDYKAKRDAMLNAADKYLKGLCEWEVPGAGLFLWLKVLGVNDTWDMVLRRGVLAKVVLVSGHAFMTDPTRPCQYLRASFSTVSTPLIHQGMERLAELIRMEINRQSNGITHLTDDPTPAHNGET